MKSKILLLLFMASVIGSCTQSSTSTDSQETKTTKTAETSQTNNLEEDLQFIRDKYKIISEATDYKTVPFETRCDEMSGTTLERKYNPKGELSYLKYVECGGHGCSTKHHYYWEGELIFLFTKNDMTPGSSHHIEEHRSYFKNGKMIQCLEKEARYYEGQAPMPELLKKAENKVVDCKPEKLTANLSKIETISLEEAQKYFCPNSSTMISTFNAGDCPTHLDMAPFDCQCDFKAEEGNKKPSIFVSNLGDNACVKINDQLNALYPDWEERDYKKELKDLSNAPHWISIKDNSINYFGKPLSFYKYDNEVEFLTDVILASGRNIDRISIQSSTANEMVKKMEMRTQIAIARAKHYKAKGGNDPLTIVKYDNRSYDVFVRYRQVTQYEGEANEYEGIITLLENRGTEILETKTVKGSCGC